MPVSRRRPTPSRRSRPEADGCEARSRGGHEPPSHHWAVGCGAGVPRELSSDFIEAIRDITRGKGPRSPSRSARSRTHGRTSGRAGASPDGPQRDHRPAFAAGGRRRTPASGPRTDPGCPSSIRRDVSPATIVAKPPGDDPATVGSRSAHHSVGHRVACSVEASLAGVDAIWTWACRFDPQGGERAGQFPVGRVRPLGTISGRSAMTARARAAPLEASRAAAPSAPRRRRFEAPGCRAERSRKNHHSGTLANVMSAQLLSRSILRCPEPCQN